MYKCKCCGHETLPVPPEEAVAYICPICWWENDVFTADDDAPSDENHGLSLNEGRKNYRQYGICDPRLKSKEHIHLSTFAQVDEKLGDHAPFLVALTENEDNALHITLRTAVVGEQTRALPDMIEAMVAEVLSGCRPITPGEKQIDICFDNYIMYQVRNESYASIEKTAKCGKYLLVFADSKLLEYAQSVCTMGKDGKGNPYPGPWRHYGIYTQNSVIDVISHFEPYLSMQ